MSYIGEFKPHRDGEHAIGILLETPEAAEYLARDLLAAAAAMRMSAGGETAMHCPRGTWVPYERSET